jgi:hypothetical protein
MSTKTLGRPTRKDNPSIHHLTLRLTDAELEMINLYSWRYRQSKSEVVRMCLDVFGVF